MDVRDDVEEGLVLAGIDHDGGFNLEADLYALHVSEENSGTDQIGDKPGKKGDNEDTDNVDINEEALT